ncbi:MAG: hypothetical protein HY043_08130 [Verrucomicrobia bacterium]|nr:hypothetical protein [Verrucomicrobiota bacterium]
MKTTLLLAIVAAAGVGFANRTEAGDVFLSPRATQMQYELRTVPGTTVDLLDRSAQVGSPKGIAFAESIRKVSGTTEDKVYRYAGAVSPRSLANEPWRLEQIQVAPLK